MTPRHVAVRPAARLITGRAVRLALASSLTLAVAACGDDDDPSSGSASDLSAPAAPTPPPSASPGSSPDATVTVPVDEPVSTTGATTEATTGGSGPDTAAATPEGAWRQEMNALCDDAALASAQIEEPATVGDLDRAVGELVDAGDIAMEGAAELDTPASVQADVDELISLWEDKREQLQGLSGRFEDAGYAEDESLDDISDEEAREIAGEALDQADLREQSAALGVTCFGA